MTLNEFIEELLKLQKEGKGEYKVRGCCELKKKLKKYEK